MTLSRFPDKHPQIKWFFSPFLPVPPPINSPPGHSITLPLQSNPTVILEEASLEGTGISLLHLPTNTPDLLTPSALFSPPFSHLLVFSAEGSTSETTPEILLPFPLACSSNNSQYPHLFAPLLTNHPHTHTFLQICTSPHVQLGFNDCLKLPSTDTLNSLPVLPTPLPGET